MSEIEKKEKIQEGIKSIYNIALSFIPGGSISNELFEYRGRIYQKRLNRFSELLKDGFEKISGKDFNSKTIKDEDIVDAFENIVRKVLMTKSEEKLIKYRNILLRQFYEKDDAELLNKYVALLDDISETQILILSEINSKSEYHHLIKSVTSMAYEAQVAFFMNKGKLTLINGKSIEGEEFELYILDLKAKGLITLQGDVDEDGLSTLLYDRTALGHAFISFIDEYGVEV